MSGIDVAVCRAVAASVLGDAAAVELVQTGEDTDHASLVAGRIDIEFGRDSVLGPAAYTTPVYFDGIGLMSRRAGATSVEDLAGQAVCVAQADAGAARTALAAASARVDVAIRDSLDAAAADYAAGVCAAVAGRRSRLAVWRAAAPTPGEHAVFVRPLAATPFRAAVRRGDARWLDVVEGASSTIGCWALARRSSSTAAQTNCGRGAGCCTRLRCADCARRKPWSATRRTHDHSNTGMGRVSPREDARGGRARVSARHA